VPHGLVVFRNLWMLVGDGLEVIAQVTGIPVTLWHEIIVIGGRQGISGALIRPKF